MSSFPISRGPLLVLSVLIILVYVLRAFLSVSSGDSLADSVSMLTWNIWFSPTKMQERMKALGKIVNDLHPDILAFQEVTRESLAFLRKERWFSRYHMIPPDVTGQENHFVVILSVFPVVSWLVHPFKIAPYKNRKVVWAVTKSAVSSGAEFIIGTTHLVHSERNTRMRELQLRETLHILSVYENVCVMGDMNIFEGRFKADGVVILPSSWTDAWLSVPENENKNGYTWNARKNPFSNFRSNANATYYSNRLDRVLCKLSDFRVKEIKIVGAELTQSKIVPSDHYGLFTVIELSENVKHKGDETSEEVFFKRPLNWEKSITQEGMVFKSVGKLAN